MAGGVSKTAYTMTPGGAGVAGYFNPGGWTTTLTTVSTSQKEACGIFRRDGANTYVYAQQGAQSASAGMLMILATNSADADGVLPVCCFTQNTAGGTAVQWNVKAMAICDVASNKYAWYLVQGFANIRVATNTVSATVLSPICVSEASGSAFCGAGGWASAQGWALTTIASDTQGGAYINFTKGW